MAQMTVADYVIEFLADRGIRNVFGYIGGAVIHLVNSLGKSERVKFVQLYHEQIAAFAAEGYARQTGTFGVALATSGPGATNMITGIADAFFDSIPVLFLTGQVNTYEYKKEKPVRQQGFQETDIVAVVKPITKYSTMVMEADRIRWELERACHLAQTGRPGPVLLDIPMDIQRTVIETDALESFVPQIEEPEPAALGAVTRRIADLLIESKRPLVLAGGGCNTTRGRAKLLEFCEKNQIPVVVSLMGKGSFPEDHPLYAGFIGSYGNRSANMIMANSDLLLALGTRLDTRQTGTRLDSFIRSGRIVHIDIDAAEIEHSRIKREIAFKADVSDFLESMLALDGLTKTEEVWQDYLARIGAEFSQSREVSKNVQNTVPYRAMEILNESAAPGQVFCADIGQNQMFAAQMLRIKQGQRFYTSGGMAPMGYALGAGIGAAFSGEIRAPVFVVIGDGGLQISSQGLMTLAQYRLPVKVIVLNNYALGMIVQFQDLYFESRYIGTTNESGYLVPDFKLLAGAYSLPYHRFEPQDLTDSKKLATALAEAGPALIEIVIEEKTIVSPKIQVDTPIEDQNPKLDRQTLKDSMLIGLYGESESVINRDID